MNFSRNNTPTKLVIIDGNAIMHRAYHAIPPLTSKKTDEPINAVYGLVSMLMRIVDDLKPTHLAVCFDRPEKTFRQEAYEAYQSQRPEMEDNLSSQFERAKEVLESMDIKIFDKAGYEADDLIGTLSEIASNSKIDETVIVTGDRDILQLVDDKKNIKVFMPVNGLSKGKLFGESEVIERMGVKSKQIVDYKGLVGDPSDNYPGVSGIGPKTAENLLEKYETFENVYKHIEEITESTKNKLINGREMGEMSYKLATILKDVDVKVDFEKLSEWDMGGDLVIEKFKEIGFKTLLNRTLERSEKKEETLKTKKKLTKTEIEKIAVKLAKKLGDKVYAIRGTASLVLQGFDMGADDIDLICDAKTVEIINSEFKDELIKNVEYSESDKFKSYFGQLVIDNILVEVMGEWQIKNDKEKWGEVYDGSGDGINIITIDGSEVRVTKPEIELKASGEMGRWNEFHKIKKQIESKNQTSLF